MNQSKKMNTQQVADLVGLSQSAIRRRCASGRLAAEKIGNDWWIKTRDALKIERKRKPKEVNCGIDENDPERSVTAGESSAGSHENS